MTKAGRSLSGGADFCYIYTRSLALNFCLHAYDERCFFVTDGSVVGGDGDCCMRVLTSLRYLAVVCQYQYSS